MALPQCDEWWIDSGASHYRTFDKNGMHKYVTSKDPLKVTLAYNSIFLAHGKGNLHVAVYDGAEKVKLLLTDVYGSP